MTSKSVSQNFKMLFQTGDINSFVLRGVFFSRYVQKATSLTKKTSVVKSETHFKLTGYRKLTRQSIKGKFHH